MECYVECYSYKVYKKFRRSFIYVGAVLKFVLTASFHSPPSLFLFLDQINTSTLSSCATKAVVVGRHKSSELFVAMVGVGEALS